jgi:hypothetical protein
MLKAVIDFEADGRQIKAGQEILPDTLSADTLLQPLIDKGCLVYVEAEKTASKKSEPAHKAGKEKK